MEEMETRWEKLLQIRTTGRDDTNADQYRYPYEPTPYCVLERLAASGYIGRKQVLVDYGCGKGRVDFFLSSQTRCRSIGIEFDERIYARAAENRKTAAAGGRTTFVNGCAEEFELPDNADRFYFFNPFSIEILQKVMGKVRESYYRNPRELFFFFYYPSSAYLAYLMTENFLEFEDEIDCRDLFPGENSRERIMIFKSQ